MTSGETMGAVFMGVGFLALAGLAIYQWVRKPDPRRAIVEEAQAIDPVVRALRQEMSSLKVYLFFLPLIWGVIWGVLFLALR